MNTTTTLSRYRQKDSSVSDAGEDTQEIQITQVVSCIFRAKDKVERQNRKSRENLIRDHIEGSN